MITVLFVDDEPMLLSALRRQLRPLRQEWDMHFADSAAQAIMVLETTACDVVVSDIRMPGRSGVELLTEVAARWPRTIRIILSGEADLETACRSVKVTHQFLAKPTPLETLKATITRARRLQEMVHDPDLIQRVGALSTLPSVPHLYTELMRKLQEPECTIAHVGELIRCDIAMAAGVLRLVNSAYFALSRRITDIVEAVTLLGIDLVKTLVLGVGLFRQFEQLGELDAYVRRLCDHSLKVALSAKEVASDLGLDRPTADLACMAGMLHDVGELVLAANHPDLFAGLLHDATAEGCPVWQKERAVLGTSHMEIGAYLLALWGLPDAVVEAAAFHHTPGAVSEALQPEVITAVHLANHLANETYGDAGPARASLDETYLRNVGAEAVAASFLAKYGTAA